MTQNSYRSMQALLFLVSLLVMFASFYFQYVQQMQPCPLCLMQRYLVVLGVILSLCAIIADGNHKNLMSSLQIVTALAGCYFAGRQLWLQSLPLEQVPACLPGLDILIRYFPLKDVIHALFWGTAECSEHQWQLLGLSMATWSLFFFIAYFLSAILLRFRFLISK